MNKDILNLLSNKLNLKDKSAEEILQIGIDDLTKSVKELVKNISAKYLSKAHHWLILHGRYICQARKPKCEECGLTPYCKFFASK